MYVCVVCVYIYIYIYVYIYIYIYSNPAVRSSLLPRASNRDFC